VSDAPAATPGGAGDPMPRRRFLEMAATCVGACAGAGALGVATIAVVGTPLQGVASGELWVDLGPLARLPDGQPVKLSIEGERRDAWQRFPKRSLGNAIVLRRGEQVSIYSAVCPHNGCDVLVQSADLLCPCHDSRFATEDGRVTGGPSPRGLDPMQTEVKDGRVRVRFQRFEIGTPERKAL
jgi:menaquinol-cytochrome c reductase iron-sulfur subunit